MGSVVSDDKAGRPSRLCVLSEKLENVIGRTNMRHDDEIAEAVKAEREAIAVMVENIEPMAQRDGKGAEHAEVTRALCCTIAALIRGRK